MTSSSDTTVFVLVDRTGMRVWPKGSLAFYPEAFGEGAPHLPSATGHGSDAERAATRAMALLQQAASFRRAGQPDGALAAYAELADVDVLLPGLDAPADIVALHARCLTFASLGKSDDLGREAGRLAAAILDRRRMLGRRVYSYYLEQARQWLDSTGRRTAGDMEDPGRVARAVAVGDLFDRWRATSLRAGSAIDIGQSRVNDVSLTTMVRANGEAFAAVVVSPGAFETRIADLLATAAPGVAWSMADVNGTVVVGKLPAPAPERVIRTAAETGLPWTLAAAPGTNWSADAAATERQRLVTLGVALVVMAVVAGAWITGRAMHRELEAARLQAEFVAAVSHEFRTPLAAFGQLTELLVDGRVASEADREEYYLRLQHESRRLDRLVEDLLDFRRMEAGAQEYAFGDVDVVALTREVVDECRPRETTSGPQLAFNAPDEPVAVRADRESLARAVRNLIENALKYARDTPVVEVRVERRGSSVSIAVADTGPGISPEARDAVFDKFVRVGDRDAVRGTGLGLAMVRHIVRAHGGTVQLDSEVGRGSTFTISLPSHITEHPRFQEA
jgi:two-component system phosphate regulon sensor histidine kinase PhoR